MEGAGAAAQDAIITVASPHPVRNRVPERAQRIKGWGWRWKSCCIDANLDEVVEGGFRDSRPVSVE